MAVGRHMQQLLHIQKGFTGTHVQTSVHINCLDKNSMREQIGKCPSWVQPQTQTKQHTQTCANKHVDVQAVRIQSRTCMASAATVLLLIQDCIETAH